MACLHPFLRKIPGRTRDNGYYPVPCGRCLKCLIDRRQSWEDRLTFQMADLDSDQCNFVRLSYSDEHLPEKGVNKEDIQLFLKRWRKHFPSGLLKYYIVAEYGEKGDVNGYHRPHYHCCFFGPVSTPTPPRYPTPRALPYLTRSWTLGYCDVRLLNPSRIRYALKYLDKQFADRWHPGAEKPYWEQKGLNAPFILCSKGLGSKYMESHPESFSDDGTYISIGGTRRPLVDTTETNSVI